MSPELKWEVFYPHPPEHVWDALTDPRALSEWLQPEEDAIDYRILEAVEQQRISYLWKARNLDAVVAFELHAAAGGTTLRVRMDERAAVGAQVDVALEWLRSYLSRAVTDTSGHPWALVK